MEEILAEYFSELLSTTTFTSYVIPKKGAIKYCTKEEIREREENGGRPNPWCLESTSKVGTTIQIKNYTNKSGEENINSFIHRNN